MTTDLGPTADQIDDMRKNILHRVTPSGDSVAVPTPHRVTGRRIGFATLGVATLAAALIAANVLAPGGVSGGATAEAAEFLHTAAAATIETSDPVVGPGQYLRIATNAVYGASTGKAGYDEYWLAPSTSVLYIPADRSGEWVWERHPLQPTAFFGGTKEIALEKYQEWLSDPQMNGLRYGVGGAFSDTSSGRDYGMDAMPRDPSALRDYFYDSYADGSASIDEDVWVRITDLLRTGEVPADLRATLFRVIALIPGVEIIDNQAALDGRTGVALARVEAERGSDTQVEIIIDPETGLLIGERTVTLAPLGEIPAGTAVSWSSISTTVVNSAPQR